MRMVGQPSCYMYAASEGHSEIVNTLLQRSYTNINQLDRRGWTPLAEVVDQGHTEIVRMLLTRKDIDVTAS
jgi:ankyrin repeat protein